MKRTLTLCATVVLAACASDPVGERPGVTSGDLDRVTAVLKRDFHERGQAKMNRGSKPRPHMP